MLNGDLTTAKKYFFSALSDETRLSILHALKENGEMCVNDICKATGKDQSLVSHHMACLRNCGLVNTEKNGKAKNGCFNRDTGFEHQHQWQTDPKEHKPGYK